MNNQTLNDLFQRDLSYAESSNLINTVSALDFLEKEKTLTETDRVDGLSAAWLLIELDLPVSEEEMDRLLAAALLHIPAKIKAYTPEELQTKARVGEDVIALLRRLINADHTYDGLADDRLLLIIKAVEQSNRIENLCNMTVEEAKALMLETKRFVLPGCLAGKEKYPEFDTALSGILEKLRGLISVADILFKRYDAEEEALYEEIFELQEENIRIRRAIREFTQEMS